MYNLEDEINKAAGLHGKLCPGTVIGVRMAILGLRKIGISDPKGKERKDFMVFVENDRCPIDALQSVSGCRLSSRALKFYDYGKMAASFLNLSTGKAVRIVCPDETKGKVSKYFSDPSLSKKEIEVEAYKAMSDDELLTVSYVNIKVLPEDMPGKTIRKIHCSSCNEIVSDKRDIEIGGKVLCKACAGKGYYTLMQ